MIFKKPQTAQSFLLNGIKGIGSQVGILGFVVSCFLLLPGCQEKAERIAFSSGASGNSDIYIMNSDGSNLVQLTRSADEEWGPTWINTSEISFLRQSGDKISRHKIDIHSKKESPLKHPSNCILDDKNILYAQSSKRQLYQCQGDIYLVEEESGQQINLTESIDGISQYPSWSFDEKSVVFTNAKNGNNDLFKIDIATSQITQLTNFPSNDERGEMSPDGSSLLFSSDLQNKGNQDILLLDLATNEVQNVTSSEGTELIARWSADGRRVYYGGNNDGNWEIYSYDFETMQHQRLTNDDAFDGDPRVNPR